MKRIDLLRHLREHRCDLLREGSRHTVVFNSANQNTSTVPRHREINESLVRKICRDLEIPTP